MTFSRNQSSTPQTPVNSRLAAAAINPMAGLWPNRDVFTLDLQAAAVFEKFSYSIIENCEKLTTL